MNRGLCPKQILSLFFLALGNTRDRFSPEQSKQIISQINALDVSHLEGGERTRESLIYKVKEVTEGVRK